MTVARLAAVVLLASGTGCDVVDGSDVPTLADRLVAADDDVGRPDADVGSPAVDPVTPMVDAGDTGTPASTGSCGRGACWWSESGGCGSVGVPTPEMAPVDTPDGDVGPIHLAYSRLWLGQTSPSGKGGVDAWRDFGFDLDGRCTGPTTCPDDPSAGPSCEPATSQLPIDGDGCRDSTFARYQPVVAQAPELGELIGLSESAINCSLHAGRYGYLLRITGYNGLPDDDAVRIDLYSSAGFVQAPLFECPLEGFRDRYPRWLPSTEWYVDRADLTGPIERPGTLPDSKQFSETAYVRDGYLVAFVDDAISLRLAGDNAAYPGWAMRLNKAVLTARIQRGGDDTWSATDGIVAGRILSDDLLASFRQVGVCPDGSLSSIYETVAQYVRDASDLLADGSVAPETACDAMSVTLGFELHQVTPGPAIEVSPVVDCCLPENEGSDSCPVGCGDGVRVGSEVCDTAIAAGQPDACPSRCQAADPCRPQSLVGTGCDARCEETLITAVTDGDGCCPAGADTTDDSDCAPVCGNGVLEGSETCDPPGTCSSVDSCQSDACVQATVTGRAETCSFLCTRTELVTTCMAGDGCCPSACDAGSDSDCPAAMTR